jgi:hypothetical protein
MQLKCTQNAVKTQWNKLDWPCPATESIILVSENKRRITGCDAGHIDAVRVMGASLKARQNMANQEAKDIAWKVQH